MIRLSLLVLVLLVGVSPVLAQTPMQRENAAVATREYARTGRAQPVIEGTTVMWPYGHGTPTLRCAPLRVCTIVLQSGETVLDDVTGDPVRWEVEFGRGPENTPLAVVKPRAIPNACDLTTNLIITTDRRIYEVLLDSPPCRGQEESLNPNLPYRSKLNFYYPDELIRQHAAVVAAPAAVPLAVQVGAVADDGGMDVADLASLYFAYSVQRDRRFPWEPEQVFDNGLRTCVRLPQEASRYPLPVLFELDALGNMSVVNYTVRDGCYLVDRVMERMVLVLGGDVRGEPMRLLVVRRPERRRR